MLKWQTGLDFEITGRSCTNTGIVQLYIVLIVILLGVAATRVLVVATSTSTPSTIYSFMYIVNGQNVNPTNCCRIQPCSLIARSGAGLS
jgi:hypothetical protein